MSGPEVTRSDMRKPNLRLHVAPRDHASSSTQDSSSNVVDSDLEVYQETSFSESTEDILSIVWHGNMLGAACYNVSTAELKVMADHPETSRVFRLLHMILRQEEPVHVVISCKANEEIIKILRNNKTPQSYITSETSSDSSDKNLNRQVHLQPSLDFAYENCKYRLQHLTLPTMSKNASEEERQIYMSTLIDFTKTCMVKAAGGLLKFLERRKFGIELEDTSTPLVTSITLLSLENTVYVDDNSLSALQIFQLERHPSVYKSGSCVKEGLSLYGICNRCKSPTGSKELRRWFLQPINNLELIIERQKAIKFLVDVQNLELMHTLQSCLKNIKPVNTILCRMRTAEALVSDWQRLYKTVYNAMALGDICRSLPQNINIFKQISKSFTPELFRIASLIDKIIDFDESVRQGHFAVKIGVDDRLDQKKRTYNGLPDFMTKVAQQEILGLPEDIQECSVIYLPQLGYLLAIPATEVMKQTQNYAIENLDYMFISNNIVHYKSAKTRTLDHLLGDTECEITDDETEIMHKLQNVILDMSKLLYDVLKFSAELDCLISLAVIAKEFNFVMPLLSPNGAMSITKGRHPLQELCVPSFVPNDTNSSYVDGKIQIISGPNATGKSIYIKQVALIVFLAHIGSFVPAEKAQIPLIDQIFTRVQAVESVSINMSRFCMELTQVSKAMNYATAKSLVIIDEFGKGTEPNTGLVLLTATINYFMQKESSCPFVFLSTHFYDLFNKLPSNNLVKFQTMEVMNDGNEIVSLFKLLDGRAAGSFGRYTALQAGLPQHILDREKQVHEMLRTKQVIAPRNAAALEAKYRRHSMITEEFLQLKLEERTVSQLLKHILEVYQEQQKPNEETSSTDTTHKSNESATKLA